MSSETTLVAELEGVGVVTASRLREAGFTTIESIAITPM
ncbi:MAG: hypothetical protein QG670_2281, partial [Thermoproteota archaeon]|nr:hypothetical protein [Thermoproteota archaeon]